MTPHTIYGWVCGWCALLVVNGGANVPANTFVVGVEPCPECVTCAPGKKCPGCHHVPVLADGRIVTNRPMTVEPCMACNDTTPGVRVATATVTLYRR